MGKGGAAVFRYVKQGPAKVTLPGFQILGTVHWAPGQQGAVDRVAQAWDKLWVAPEPAQEDLDRLCASLAKLRKKHVRRRLEGGYLAARAAELPTGKMAASDGWSYDHFRGWPPALWEWVADLFELVELKHKWPAQLSVVEVCMLEKGHTGEARGKN